MTGAVEHDRMKVEFEEGQRRLANLQAEAHASSSGGRDGGRNPQIAGTCGELEGTSVAQERPACVRDNRGWFIPPIPTLVLGELLHMVGGSTDRFARGIDLRRHVTRVGVSIKDDRRNGTFEGNHKCSHGAGISRRQREVACVEPLLPGSCWRLMNARCGFRGVRV